MSDLDDADAAYEAAEAVYLNGIRSNTDRPTLTDLAADVAAKAGHWNAVVYDALHASPDDKDLDALTERTEVLSELWADVAEAYRD